MNNNRVRAYCNTPQQNRRSIRLKGYDYRQAGAYFVTVSTQNRECLFGDIADGEMVLNDAGRMVETVWEETPKLRPNIALDEFVVMPNHVHGIVTIIETCRGVLQYAPTQSNTPKFRSPTQTIGAIIRGFKSAATKGINEMRHTPGAKLWQRNYYEHIIRNENEFHRIREYIINNPMKWELDSENPDCRGTACRAQA